MCPDWEFLGSEIRVYHIRWDLWYNYLVLSMLNRTMSATREFLRSRISNIAFDFLFASIRAWNSTFSPRKKRLTSRIKNLAGHVLVVLLRFISALKYKIHKEIIGILNWNWIIFLLMYSWKVMVTREVRIYWGDQIFLHATSSILRVEAVIILL